MCIRDRTWNMESICDAIPGRCVEFLCGNDEAGNITCCNWKQYSPRCDRIHSFTYNRSSNRNINQPFFFFTSVSYTHLTLTMDDTAFNDIYNNLNAFNKDMVVAPVDAYSTYDKATNSYSIVPEVYGNTVKKKKLKPLLKEAILNMDKSIDIEKNDCYKNPAYKKDTKEVVEANKTMNKYVQETITYDFDDRTEELKGKKISKWLYETDKHEVKVHSEMAAKYIKKLADKYDTVGIKRNFTSICGNKVSRCV